MNNIKHYQNFLFEFLVVSHFCHLHKIIAINQLQGEKCLLWVMVSVSTLRLSVPLRKVSMQWNSVAHIMVSGNQKEKGTSEGLSVMFLGMNFMTNLLLNKLDLLKAISSPNSTIKGVLLFSLLSITPLVHETWGALNHLFSAWALGSTYLNHNRRHAHF